MKQILSVFLCLMVNLFLFGQNNVVDLNNGAPTDGFIDLTGYKGITGSNARTVEALIQARTVSGLHSIVSWGASPSNGERWEFLLSSSNLRVEIQGSGISGSTTLNPNQTYNVAVVYEGAPSHAVRMYIDGNLEVSGTLTVNTVGTSDVRIGHTIHTGSRHFDGKIEDLKIWNVALSESEIQANICTPVVPASEPNLVNYFMFNETSGTTVIDSKSGNNGTISGNVTRVATFPTAVACPSDVPTLSEWGLINLAILLMTFGTVYLIRPSFVKNLD